MIWFILILTCIFFETKLGLMNIHFLCARRWTHKLYKSTKLWTKVWHPASKWSNTFCELVEVFWSYKQDRLFFKKKKKRWGAISQAFESPWGDIPTSLQDHTHALWRSGGCLCDESAHTQAGVTIGVSLWIHSKCRFVQFLATFPTFPLFFQS